MNAEPKRWRELLLPSGMSDMRMYTKGNLQVLVCKEPTGSTARLLWHLSISHPDRYPTWDEICDARYALLPDDCVMAQLLPPRREYVNLHPNCFHLWEIEG